MRVFVSLAALWLLLAAGPAGGQEPQGPPASLPEGLEAGFRRLRDAHEAELARFRKLLAAADSQEEQDRAHREAYPDNQAYARRCWELVEGRTQVAAAVEPLIWITRLTRDRELLDKTTRGLLHHARSPELAPALQELLGSVSGPVDDLFRLVLAENPHRAVRARAARALAASLRRTLAVRRGLDRSPEQEPAYARIFGELAVRRIRGLDTGRLEAEAELLDVQARALESRGRAGGKGLRVGAEAPGLRGKDLQGRELELAEHRGRVVVLVFWADWLLDAREAARRLRVLADRFQKQPVVFLGVSGDWSRERARDAATRMELPWPTLWDGGPPGAAARAYKVRTWPQAVVVGPGGRIRHRGTGLEALEQAITDLAADIEEGG